MFFPTGLTAGALMLVSGYALSQSIFSIANIKKYESKAEKAAEWSQTAQKRLRDTRYTIGTGFVAVNILFLKPFIYLFLCCLSNHIAFGSASSRWSRL